jgi:hypothetical protein
MDQQGAAKIRFAVHVNARVGFNVLREQLGKNNLFREKFGADYDLRSWRTTGSQERYDEDQRIEPAHQRINFSCDVVKRKEELF